MTKGVLGLVFWLFLGFAFTEITALSLNAWLMHESATHRTINTVATIDVQQRTPSMAAQGK